MIAALAPCGRRIAGLSGAIRFVIVIFFVDDKLGIAGFSAPPTGHPLMQGAGHLTLSVSLRGATCRAGGPDVCMRGSWLVVAHYHTLSITGQRECH